MATSKSTSPQMSQEQFIQYLNANPMSLVNDMGPSGPVDPYEEYNKYSQARDAYMRQTPEGLAYTQAEAALDAFKKANPNTSSYQGYSADPQLKQQYQDIYNQWNSTVQPFFAQSDKYEAENPYTGEMPTYSIDPIETGDYWKNLARESTTTPPTNPVTGAPGAPGGQDPIAQLYRDVLGRDPDPEGLAYWRQQFGDTVDPNEFAQFQRGAQPELAQRAGGPETEALDPSQSTLSPNFANYVYNMLAKGEQAANLPFQEYTGQRFAGPSDLQQQAFARYAGMAEPSQFGEATGIARLAAQQAQGLGYTPGQFTADRISPQALQQYQMTAPRDVNAQRARAAQLGAAPQMEGVAAQAAQLGAAPQSTAAQMEGPGAVGFERVGAERVSAPDLRDLRMEAAAPVSAERVGTQDITAAQTGYRPDLQTFQMQAPEERVTAESFAQPGTAQALMSPYMQGVIDKQTREAIRQADIARGGRGARFAQAGAFGGSRQAIEEAEAERNLQTQLGDITATGLQAAYDRAQQQFNQEQQARQAAQQANIGTGLTVGQQNLAAQLGVQQLGAQTGLQTALANLTNEQQARVQSEANRLQAQGLNQQQALQAALANQGVQQQANLQNLSAALQTQGLGAQTGMESQRLNQSAGLQALLANQQAGMQTGQFNAQQAYNAALQNAQMRQQAELANTQLLAQYGLQGAELQQAANMLTAQQMQQANQANQQMLGQYGLQQGQFQQAANMQNPQMALQAALANQQTGYNVGAQNLAANLGVQQLGAQQDLTAQQLNQQYGLDAQRLAEQSRQFGAGYGLQGIGQQISAGQLMSGIGAQAGQYGLGSLQGMLAAGGTQQQLAQQPYDFGYQQWQQSQQYPFQQATYMQSLLGGLPLGAAPYNSGTSGFGNALAGAATGLGIYGLLNQGTTPTTGTTGASK